MEESTKEEQISAHQKLVEVFFEKLESEMKQLFRQSRLLGLTDNLSGLMDSVGPERVRVGALQPHQLDQYPAISKIFRAPNKYPNVCNSQLNSVNSCPPSEPGLTSGLVNTEDGNEGSRIPRESSTCINTSRKRGRNLVVESSGRANIEAVLFDDYGDSRKKLRDSKSSDEKKETLRNNESKSVNWAADPVAEDKQIPHLENEVKRLEMESFEFRKAFDHLKKENATLMLAIGEAKKEELKAKLEAVEIKSREANLLKEIEELKRQLSYQEGMVQSFTSVFKAMFFKNGLDSGLQTGGVIGDSVLFNMQKVPEIVDSPPIGCRDSSEAVALSKVQAGDPHEGPSCPSPEEQQESVMQTENTSTPHKVDFESETFELRRSLRKLQTTRRHSNGTEAKRHGEFISSKANASSCLASEKTNGKVSEEVFHDFGGERSAVKFQMGQIWAMYDGGLPNRYVQIKKIKYYPFELHVQLLESLEPCAMQPLCCGIFKVQTGETLHSQSSFSHLVEAKPISANIFEIYPKKGEIWAIYRNWKAVFSHFDLASCDYDMVEVLDDTVQSVEVSPLVRVTGFKSVFRDPRGQRSNTGVLVIPRSELGRFCHQIPAFQLTGEKEGKLRGYWELDPAAVPGKMWDFNFTCVI
ncbi:hypothetical protein LguiA_010907 [Lonicera macranthoides]